MARCLKIITSLLVLAYIFVPSKFSYGLEEIYTFRFLDEEVVALNTKEEKEVKKEVINITDDELVLLSKLITGEARGESYEGQLAVAAVVVNRVKDDRFPNSVRDVIYQKNAFSVVQDGSIKLAPTESAYKAAQAALYGEDPTGEAIFFWNPDIATCKWIKTLNPYMRIGNHVFAK